MADMESNRTPIRRHRSFIQLFREKLSDKSVKTNATMSKVIIGNGGFTVD